MIFDEELTAYEFYNSYDVFSAMMTCTYIVEETQPRYNVEIDCSTVDFRTGIILELLDNKYIKSLLLDASSNPDCMHVPYWAYDMVTPNLTSDRNLDKVQKEYGEEKVQELIQFVAKFSRKKPFSDLWEPELLLQQDLSEPLALVLDEILSDRYPHSEYIIKMLFETHLNYFAAKFFIMQLVDESFKNEPLEKLLYALLKDNTQEELFSKLSLSLAYKRAYKNGGPHFPASFESKIKKYSMRQLTKLWGDRIQKVYKDSE